MEESSNALNSNVCWSTKLGSGGKSSLFKPLKRGASYLPERMRAVCPSELSIVISFSGVLATIFSRRFTGRVMSPSSSMSAVMEQRMPKSRFVVVKSTLPFSAFIKTLFKTGICGFELTTLETCFNPMEKCSLLILNFIRSVFLCFN